MLNFHKIKIEILKSDWGRQLSEETGKERINKQKGGKKMTKDAEREAVETNPSLVRVTQVYYLLVKVRGV